MWIHWCCRLMISYPLCRPHQVQLVEQRHGQHHCLSSMLIELLEATTAKSTNSCRVRRNQLDSSSSSLSLPSSSSSSWSSLFQVLRLVCPCEEEEEEDRESARIAAVLTPRKSLCGSTQLECEQRVQPDNDRIPYSAINPCDVSSRVRSAAVATTTIKIGLLEEER